MAIKVTQALIYAELVNIKKTLEDHTLQDNANFRELKESFLGTLLAPGLNTRVDRIEQAEVVKKRHFGYVWSVILVIVGAVVKLFVG